VSVCINALASKARAPRPLLEQRRPLDSGKAVEGVAAEDSRCAVAGVEEEAREGVAA
jgi:hypothetical protein